MRRGGEGRRKGGVGRRGGEMGKERMWEEEEDVKKMKNKSIIMHIMKFCVQCTYCFTVHVLNIISNS